MEAAEIPVKFRDRLCEMLAADSNTIHIIWCCKDNSIFQLGRSIMPNDAGNPLYPLCENGYIEQKSLSAFLVYCSQIEEGIIAGTDKHSIAIDVMMRFSPDEPYRLCKIISFLLHGENNLVTDIHVVIRPYSASDTFDKEVLSMFSSDQAPSLFGKRIREMIDSTPADKRIAFIQFDVERFKLINDTYGSDVGDDLLRFFTGSLHAICREDQPFCRLNADVFMIVTAFSEEDELISFIRNVESMLCGYNGMDYRLVFGIAIVDDRNEHTRKLGDNATLARQAVKGNALNNVGFYERKMKTDLHKMQTIEDDMQNALINGEFVMYLQPKYSISTEKIIGAEALARWIHPTKGMISPAEFIPVFEKNGFILKLDQYIWESACKKIREWIDKGLKPVPISVNVSREYIQSFDVSEKVTQLTQKYNIPEELIELEITESLDTQGVEKEVKKMKDAGFTMLMDDFGSGYSSLNMLKTTQFDVLKIDRCFLSEFMDSERGRKIISHTISMSRDIGLNIIAEGVETLEQAKFLSNCGCDQAQGFYYSKPITSEEFDRRLVTEA